jgi:hypothetical protein
MMAAAALLPEGRQCKMLRKKSGRTAAKLPALIAAAGEALPSRPYRCSLKVTGRADVEEAAHGAGFMQGRVIGGGAIACGAIRLHVDRRLTVRQVQHGAVDDPVLPAL